MRTTSVMDVHSSCTALKKSSDHFGFNNPEPIKMTDRATVDAMLLILGQLGEPKVRLL
ncbi:MAG: hypothetical protein AAED33_03125 [Paracoccaceae bacterium]